MKDARIDAIRESLGARGGISGIINVVSYGYHEYQVTKDKVFLANGVVDPEMCIRDRGQETDQGKTVERAARIAFAERESRSLHLSLIHIWSKYIRACKITVAGEVS